MKSKIFYLILATALIFGCSDDNSTAPETGSGTLTMSITDSYFEISSLTIHIYEIAIHKDNEWLITSYTSMDYIGDF